jgi:hypothetical protein
MKALGSLVFLALGAECLHAQLNFLTVREAASIVERVPDVAEAQKKGECPSISGGVDLAGHDEMGFQVRRQCGPYAGQLIDNYMVDRRTGKVAEGMEDLANRKSALTAAGRVYAHDLVLEAQQRILSANEGRCLALEAARALPDWSAPDAIVSVEQVDGILAEMFFTATRSSKTRPTETVRTLAVDLSTATVRDDETGLNIASGGLGGLASKMIELRAPVWLTDEDAAAIALLIPHMQEALQVGCKAYTGGVFHPREAVIGISCPGPPTPKATYATVNLQSGDVTNTDTGKSIPTPESAHLASDLLSSKSKRRNELQKELEAACPPR